MNTTPTLWQATISFGRPGQTKTDPELTDFLTRSYGTGKKAVRGVKHLWGDSLKPHSSFENRVRGFHKNMTFEGIGSIDVCTEGERQRWIDAMQGFAINHARLTTDWLDSYDVWLEQERIEHNGAFRIEDYPTRESLASKFKFTYAILPMPSPNQFIKDQLTDELGKRLAADYEARLQNTTAQITRQVLNTLLGLINDTAESLANDGPIIDSENKKGPMAKLREYLDRIPALNITGDPTIAAIAREARTRLDYTTEELRKNQTTRQLAAAHAQGIALQFGQVTRKIEKAA
jgi:hypothetical protein